MTNLSTRLSPSEIEYLSNIASKNKIYKGGTDELSLGKAMRDIVRWCHLNNIDINKKGAGINDEVVKMIEHIHVAIPNLMYLARMQAILASDGVSDEKIIHGRRQTMDYLNNTCGDFQNTNYTQIRFSINNIGLKLAPSDKDKTSWRLQSI